MLVIARVGLWRNEKKFTKNSNHRYPQYIYKFFIFLLNIDIRQFYFAEVYLKKMFDHHPGCGNVGVISGMKRSQLRAEKDGEQ